MQHGPNILSAFSQNMKFSRHLAVPVKAHSLGNPGLMPKSVVLNRWEIHSGLVQWEIVWSFAPISMKVNLIISSQKLIFWTNTHLPT